MAEITLSTKVVKNASIGGFSLSREAVQEYAASKGLFFHATEKTYWASTDEAGDDVVSSSDIPRNDPVLVDIVERMGSAASGAGSDLRAVTVEIFVEVAGYDGHERVRVSGGEK